MTLKQNKGINIFYYVLAFCIKVAAFILFGLRITEDDVVHKWKKGKEPFLLLCAHPSDMDSVVLLSSAYPRYARFLVGEQHLHKHNFVSAVLNCIGCIPKKQFVPDIFSVKEIIKTIKKGDIVGLMPEGRLSCDGTTGHIDPSIAQLIKKLNVNVACLMPHGTFFAKPPYNHTKLFKTRITAELNAILYKEDISSMSEQEIYDIICKKISYNVCEEAASDSGLVGSHLSACKNVSNLLYVCRKCGAMNTISDIRDTLYCSKCNAIWTIDKHMNFCSSDASGKSNIREWNAFQIDTEKSLWKDDNYSLEMDVKTEIMKREKRKSFSNFGYGHISLNRNAFEFFSSEINIKIPISNLNGMMCDYQFGYIVMYYGKDILRFVLGNEKNAIRFQNSLNVLKAYR